MSPRPHHPARPTQPSIRPTCNNPLGYLDPNGTERVAAGADLDYGMSKVQAIINDQRAAQERWESPAGQAARQLVPFVDAIAEYQLGNTQAAIRSAAMDVTVSAWSAVVPLGIAAKQGGSIAKNAAALGSRMNTMNAAPKWASKSNVWSRAPHTLQDQMSLRAAQEGAGTKIIDKLGDAKFKGMEKWEYKVKSTEGRDSVIHYVRDPKTGKLMDFKFKKHSNDMPTLYERTTEPSVSSGNR